MKLYLGGLFSYYLPGHPRQVELPVDIPVDLSTLLTQLGIPIEEIQLVVLNGELVDLHQAIVTNQDEVKLFPPVGGG